MVSMMVSSEKAWGRSSVGRAPQWHCGGRRFDPDRLHACPLRKIVAGGQTGADRAALDFARSIGLPHGGWCPADRKAEDGRLSRCYPLRETPSRLYRCRTEWNARDSDATVVFTIGKRARGGSLLTLRLAERLGKPCIHLLATERSRAPARLVDFLRVNRVAVLNVAGSRESDEPGVGEWTRVVLRDALGSGGSALRRPGAQPKNTLLSRSPRRNRSIGGIGSPKSEGPPGARSR